MNNRIIFDSESYNALFEWARQNTDIMLFDDFFFRRCELHFQGFDMIAYVEVKKDAVHINIKKYGRQIIKGSVKFIPEDPHSPELHCKVLHGTPISSKRVEGLTMLAFQCFWMASNFLFFGNLLDERKIKACGKNEGDGKVIVFRKYKEQYYAIPVNAHRSPEGVFSVRGHIRRYKNGKNIWIESYMKGLTKGED